MVTSLSDLYESRGRGRRPGHGLLAGWIWMMAQGRGGRGSQETEAPRIHCSSATNPQIIACLSKKNQRQHHEFRARKCGNGKNNQKTIIGTEDYNNKVFSGGLV